MSGPVETELPPSAFCRKDKLRLSLQRSISSSDGEEDLKSRVRFMDCHDLARKISSAKHNRFPFLLLDCRGLLCYSDSHIRGAVHIACTDRFNRKRVQNSGSVLDLVSTNNRRNKSNGGFQQWNGKWRDVIVYDDGTSDLNLEANWANPISFVLAHLIQENRQPIYLTGGIKEFSHYYDELCETCGSRKDLSAFDTNAHFPLLPPALLLPSMSPSPLTPTQASCIESYENEPPTQVLPYLYVGNARDANNPELLRKLGIRYVLSVTTISPHAHTYLPSNANASDNGNSTTGEPKSQEEGQEPRTADPEFRTKLIPVSDNLCENLAPYFEEACDFIEEARKSDTRVLIHCQAGISRSPTIAIAYIMKHINMSTHDAYAFVQRSRRIISPNLNFMGQLVEYETKLKGFSSSPESSCATSTSSDCSDCTSGDDLIGQDSSVPVMMITDD